MKTTAVSFEVRDSSTSAIASEYAAAVRQLARPAGGTVYACGSHLEALPALCRAILELKFDFPTIVVGGAGVLTERGELSDVSAATGLVWEGGKLECYPLHGNSEEALTEAIRNTLTDQTGKTRPPTLLFVRPELFSPDSLVALQNSRQRGCVFGGGVVGPDGPFIVHQGSIVEASGVCAIMRGLSAPKIGLTHSCRLLSELHEITEIRGSMVTEIDGRPALEMLTDSADELSDELVLLVLSETPFVPPGGGRPKLLIRGLQGVDPDRSGLLVSDEIREGMGIAFAVRDPATSREDLETLTRELEREIAGAAPRFGFYINCASRGEDFYGSANVDTKILTNRFGKIPMAGFASAFEIAPHHGVPALQLYSGVFALFTWLS